MDGLDILTRSHVFLLQAIERLLATEPHLRGRVELCLAGALTPGDIAVAERHDFVRLHGLLPHSDTVALMRSADLLFLPMQALPAGTRASVIPYKTYEYLATRRPILAAVPDGDVRDMLAPLDHVAVVRPADVDGMFAALQQRVGALSCAADHLGGLAFERRTCVARIAEVLDGVLERAEPVPLPVGPSHEAR